MMHESCSCKIDQFLDCCVAYSNHTCYYMVKKKKKKGGVWGCGDCSVGSVFTGKFFFAMIKVTCFKSWFTKLAYNKIIPEKTKDLNSLKKCQKYFTA